MVTTDQEAPGRATAAQHWLARLALVAAAAAGPVPVLVTGFSQSVALSCSLATRGPRLVARARNVTVEGPQAVLVSDNLYGMGDVAGLYRYEPGLAGGPTQP